MSNFMGGNDNSRKATGVLNDGHWVDLLQSLVHHASATDIREPYRQYVLVGNLSNLAPISHRSAQLVVRLKWQRWIFNVERVAISELKK